MPVAIEYLEEKIRARLSGEIDHHSAQELREQIDDAVSRTTPQILEIDFAGVTFMDSSGIGLVMGRYRQMSVLGGQVVLTGLGSQQKKVMRLAGLDRLVSFDNFPENRARAEKERPIE